MKSCAASLGLNVTVRVLSTNITARWAWGPHSLDENGVILTDEECVREPSRLLFDEATILIATAGNVDNPDLPSAVGAACL
jgi:hypothetical protein